MPGAIGMSANRIRHLIEMAVSFVISTSRDFCTAYQARWAKLERSRPEEAVISGSGLKGGFRCGRRRVCVLVG